MSCEGYRDKLITALASGESSLAGDVAMHLRVCAECKKFYEAQVHLFEAIDSGVRAMVNETVPASLFPRVRTQVAEAGMPRRRWGLTWSFAAVAIAAVLVVIVGLLRRGPETTSELRDRSPAVAQGARGATGATPAQSQVITAAPKHRSTEAKIVTVPKETVTAPEVLVLAEERAAFVRFVTDLPGERDAAVALTRPATDAKDEAMEIALLQINELEVKPLESPNRE
jgi:hypothetical protein